MLAQHRWQVKAVATPSDGNLIHSHIDGDCPIIVAIQDTGITLEIKIGEVRRRVVAPINARRASPQMEMPSPAWPPWMSPFAAVKRFSDPPTNPLDTVGGPAYNQKAAKQDYLARLITRVSRRQTGIAPSEASSGCPRPEKPTRHADG
jgi:hypothetical protein